jgi:ribosomal protein S18 acetylase RimI-like enzyme
MQISLRPARAEDFDYCEKLYFVPAKKAHQEITAAATASFRERWRLAEARIIMADGAPAGWLQSRLQDDAFFLVQLFVDDSFQRRGIGTKVVNALIDEAGLAGRALTLGVVKTNPALRLYERLGFRTAHEDDRKFYMRRDIGVK